MFKAISPYKGGRMIDKNPLLSPFMKGGGYALRFPAPSFLKRD